MAESEVKVLANEVRNLTKQVEERLAVHGALLEKILKTIYGNGDSEDEGMKVKIARMDERLSLAAKHIPPCEIMKEHLAEHKETKVRVEDRRLTVWSLVITQIISVVMSLWALYHVQQGAQQEHPKSAPSGTVSMATK